MVATDFGYPRIREKELRFQTKEACSLMCWFVNIKDWDR
jgi:hypothetical protein